MPNQTEQEFNLESLLAGGSNSVTRRERTINRENNQMKAYRMFNIILGRIVREDTEFIINRNSRTIDLALVLRFNDLTANAKHHFAEWIQKKSSLNTVRVMRLEEIIEIMEIANVVIAENYYKNFCRGSFDRWHEKQISRIIYYLNKPYSLINTNRYFNRLKWLLWK